VRDLQSLRKPKTEAKPVSKTADVKLSFSTFEDAAKALEPLFKSGINFTVKAESAFAQAIKSLLPASEWNRVSKSWGLV
jgi:hypothetical protein